MHFLSLALYGSVWHNVKILDKWCLVNAGTNQSQMAFISTWRVTLRVSRACVAHWTDCVRSVTYFFNFSIFGNYVELLNFYFWHLLTVCQTDGIVEDQ